IELQPHAAIHHPHRAIGDASDDLVPLVEDLALELGTSHPTRLRGIALRGQVERPSDSSARSEVPRPTRGYSRSSMLPRKRVVRRSSASDIAGKMPTRITPFTSALAATTTPRAGHTSSAASSFTCSHA